MTLDDATEGLAKKVEDSGLEAEAIYWTELAADYQLLPKLAPPGLSADQANNDRQGQIKYLRRAPKRRARPAWGGHFRGTADRH
eukprot:3211328-Pyramimonas_sp.AAC.1